MFHSFIKTGKYAKDKRFQKKLVNSKNIKSVQAPLERYPEPSQTSEMKLFVKIVNGLKLFLQKVSS